MTLPENASPEAKGRYAARAYLFHLEQKRQARRETLHVLLDTAIGTIIVVLLFLAAWSIF